MHAAIYIYCALALGVCLLTYVLEITGRMIVPGLILLTLVGKLVLGLLSMPYVLVWYLLDAKGCKAAMEQYEATRS
jgi:hypothetical protein